MTITRRTAVAGLAAGTGLALSGRAWAQLPLPTSPVVVTVVDVAGNLALTQKAIETYRRAKPGIVSRFAFTKAPAPELPSKLKAQQAAGRVDIDLVLTGTDGIAAGIEQALWIDLKPYAGQLPKPGDIYQPAALRLNGLARGQGLCVAWYPSGPLIEYMPERVKTVPTTAEELLAWARQNKGKFMYARPANSGPGRTWIMGLPYILGDKDPTEPDKGWDKTWDYLKAIGETVDYYPGGTSQTMKELGEGSRDIIVSTTGWDINPRVLGVVPAEAKVGTLKNFRWVADAHYMAVPKGVPDEKLAVILDLMAFLLQPAQQAYTYDEGYFYPGPAVKGVTLDMAPPESRAALKEFGRPDYDRMIAETPIEMPLDPDKLVVAFRRWDEQVGSGKKR
ncbi:extracellular solute-binding protein [Methylobacterium aquaticum]|uniref:extracellular solute-binding protein n=1 Tax=Methylobacterium aquaticum TaxID=270351 RepID=UPI003D169AF1